MDSFVPWIRQHTGWLYVQIYENHLFFFDFWSLTHLWSGFVVFAFLLSRKYRHPWWLLVCFLTFYEVVEISMLYISLHVFNPETIKDQVTDILVGIFGALLAYLLVRQKARRQFDFFRLLDFEAFLVAETFSFLWVNRPYFFFVEPVPSDPLSVTNYLWRILPGYLLLRIYGWYKQKNAGVVSCVMVFAMAYFALYLFTGLVAGIYGSIPFVPVEGVEMLPDFNVSYFHFQLCYPFLVIISYEWLSRTFEKATQYHLTARKH